MADSYGEYITIQVMLTVENGYGKANVVGQKSIPILNLL